MAKPKNKTLFSVITVCFNSAKTIEQTIQSVIGQFYWNVEYIVVDGGSTDGTLEIIRRYRDQIDLIISEPDDGIYDAMNKGIKLASGDLIGLLNSDDWYEPDTMQLVAEAYESSDKATIFHGLCKYFVDGREGQILSYHHDILPSHSIAHPTCFIPKLIYEQHDLYDTEFKIAADYELLLRFYLSGVQFQRIERVLANFRIGGITSKVDSKYEDLAIHLKHGLVHPIKYRLKKWKYWLGDLLSK